MRPRTRQCTWLAGLTLLCSLLFVSAGCDTVTPSRVRALPVPPREQPIANLPARLHIRNWRGPRGQGSCVHASLKNHALWHNDFDFVRRWPHADGEYASRVMRRLDSFGYDYVFTEKADPRFLDWCDRNRHGAILWWKPAHCCTFVGWVKRDRQTFAAILDNNNPGEFELTPREQFVRLWAGYGGFALSFSTAPATAKPYLSYEVVP
jgi:hypothetical protein